ncbi:MAG TPA: family 43 glycosylhydrolase, partial [Gemmatimonadaceae bacterium]|nr:family 43 glycosylhydrolase [Gemmatimonadaceae bacterium]
MSVYLPMARRLAVAAMAAAPLAVAAQSSGVRTWCNPVDVDYRYNFEQINTGPSYRSGADPVIVTQRGQYYLFATIAAGYWRSPDLVHWTHVTPSRWPFEDIVAPAALSVRDTIYLLPARMEPHPVLFTTTPARGRLDWYNRMMPRLPNVASRGDRADIPADSVPPGPWDPAFFHDPDTERWYLYWGSSNTYPLYGIELDKNRRFTYIGTPKEMLRLHPEQHGWERFGQDHREPRTPFVEGAWMTKHAGKYYLQYGAPGTEYNVYANATYVGDSPLGPFTYAPYNPVAYKPGGFMVGAGHGNTFQDLHGNWWNTGTAWVAVNWNFERRVVMHPAGFDADGDMYADTRFGDFPHRAPTNRWLSSDELFTGWMLLSYRKPATASAALDSFPARNVTDENPRTFWVARANRPGETVTVDLEREYTVRAVQVNFTDYRSNLYGTDSIYPTRFRVLGSRDRKTWTTIADLSKEARDRPNAYIELPAAKRVRYVRYIHGRASAPNLAISDIRVFGNGSGNERPVATPDSVTVRRDSD